MRVRSAALVALAVLLILADVPTASASQADLARARRAANAAAADVARAQPFVAEPQRRVQGPYVRPGQLGEAGGALRVVGVAVREQGQRDPLSGLLRGVDDVAQVGVVLWAGVDHDGEVGVRFGDEPGVGAVQRHHGGVRREHVDGARGLS